MADKELILEDIRSLISDLDACTGELIKAKLKEDDCEIENVHLRMERLLVVANQELNFLHDYIKEQN